MNRIYRSIWNEVRGTWIAVSESIMARGKKSRNGAARPNQSVGETGKETKLNLRGVIGLSIVFSWGFCIPAYAQLFINDNGDSGCYQIVDGSVLNGQRTSSSCNNASTTSVISNSGSLIVGGTNGTGVVGGLPMSTGGTTTAGGSTANVYGFYVLSNGAYIDGSVNGTNILGIVNISGLTSLNGGASLNNKKITNLANGSVSITSTDAVNGSQLASLSTSASTSLSSATSSVVSLSTSLGS
ncbi:ESPR domain-containing protein, partial [Burkholderia territorii]|uniref:ESPR domain-containing protein n=1 Tax=Burkholderia territorii TaxID=1503055 RepID=UPI000B01AC4A